MSNMIFTPLNDFRGTGSTYDSTYRNFGVTVYKNYESNGYDDNTRNPLLSAHIAPCVEMGRYVHIIIPEVCIVLHTGKPKL